MTLGYMFSLHPSEIRITSHCNILDISRAINVNLISIKFNTMVTLNKISVSGFRVQSLVINLKLYDLGSIRSFNISVFFYFQMRHENNSKK